MRVYFIQKNKNKGAAMLISVVFFLFISVAIIAGLVSPTVRELKNSNDYLRSRQSLFLSEAGAEDAYYRLKTSKPIGSSVTLNLGGNSATTTISDSGYNEKTITALGDVDNRQRKSRLVLGAGEGTSFNYGVQTGTGGFVLGGNARVIGNVYSNGTIVGSNGAVVTGSAFSAGASGLIDNVDVGQNGVGDARAHTVRSSTIAGSLYCQTGSQNNKSCNTSQADPEAVPMPITDEMINQWKADALAGGVYTGNYVLDEDAASLGPLKIVGSLTVNNNSDLTVTGTLWVTGNVIISNNSSVSLASSYGSSEGVLVTDGTANIGNNSVFSGSGTAGSYLMVLSTSTSTAAITLANNAGAVILYAANGTVNLTNNAGARALNGYKINLNNNVVITYDGGLANSYFMSGPSGGWTIDSWKEVE